MSDQPPPEQRSRLRDRFNRLVGAQIAHPIPVLAALGCVTALALVLASHLELNTGFEALLPESRPSVIELHRVSQRTSSLSTIFVVLEGHDRDALRRAGDALVPALAALGRPWVGQVEDGVQPVIGFLKPRAGLFADIPTLEKLRDDVEARYAWEVEKRSGLGLDPDATPPAILDAETVKKRLGISSADEERYPDGYYQSKDGNTLVVAIRSGVIGSDFSQAAEALRRVGEVVGRVDPAKYDPTAHWGLSGDLAIGLSEYRLISRDLTSIGLLGAALILGVVFLYYLRLRTVLAMGLTIGIGLAWTFGITKLIFGHLNLATGFLFTIIAGNGINFSILFMARYLEERRHGQDAAGAVAMAERHTWRPTLTAASAAAVAYGALMITEFRGFREFGVIGGIGMLVCWIATYLALPPILVVMERIVPLDGSPPAYLKRIVRATAEGVPYGRPFAALVSLAPRIITVVGIALAVAGLALTVRYIRSDPMEYDTSKIESDRSAVAEVHRLIHVAMDITGFVGLDGMAIMTDRVDQIEPLKTALLARRDAAQADAKPFKDVHTLQDYVPPEQAAKIPILMQIERRVEKAKRLGVNADWASIEPYLPPADLKPFGIDDLPEAIARPFTERDGARGRILYISPLNGTILSDAYYLLRWADSFRKTTLPDGSVIYGSGRAVIYADMWNAILSDVPKAVVVSFLATLCVIALAFRERRATLAVIGSLLVGVFWTVGALALLGVKLNFLNFIALPVTFGIGVDYAVNIVQRSRELSDPLEVLRRTGGAVILCSLTTLLGYLALVGSVNFGVRSLGRAAVAGEISCLLAAVLVLPAGLLWWGSRHPASPRG